MSGGQNIRLQQQPFAFFMSIMFAAPPFLSLYLSSNLLSHCVTPAPFSLIFLSAGSIVGFGVFSYNLALQAALQAIKK